MIRNASSNFSPVQEALQSLYNLFANNGSTDGFYGSSSLRIVFIVGSTLVLIFWISFSTFLIAELAVSPANRLHGNLQQLMTGRMLKAICVDPNSAVHARLLNTVRPLVNANPCPAEWPQWVNLFKEVCESKTSKVGFVESGNFLREYNFFHQRSPPCQLSSVMDNVFQIPKAIAVHRGYPYREEVGQVFLKIKERGIAQLVARQVFETLRAQKSGGTIQEGYLKISLRRLTVTFALLAIGAGLAFVILILEWVTFVQKQPA
ncbi:uncharacterized protein LOC119766490 [Culex quinquefasciatus]|uniref:uncharacterized protein LOC119766490 n=1 Tax=Culex quinquefasciatus TaxID=7176 RepID=UPI0018E331B8|nr:uncharacterized protein LOC119766490 [Culex quinquefasciatus]